MGSTQVILGKVNGGIQERNNMDLNDLWNKKRVTLEQLSSVLTPAEIHEASIKYGSNARQILWHMMNKVDEIPLCCCGKKLGWHNDTRNYRKFCSKRCTAINSQDKIKETNLKKFGAIHFSKTSEFKEKMKSTNLQKYGVEYYTQTSEYKESATKTNLEKYGTNHPAQNETIKKKMADTFLKKYGAINPMYSASHKEKLAETNKKKYGVKSPLGNSLIREKGKETMVARYGVESPAKSPVIVEKRSKTLRRNYYDKDILDKLENFSWLESENQDKAIHQIANELGVSESNLYKYFHKNQIKIKKHFRSAMEIEFSKIWHDFTISTQDRTQIYPYEIDLFFENEKIGIEINGAYYHSERQGKDKNYHLNKTNLAIKKDILLYQFFDWEILTKKAIIVDLINHKLRRNKKIGARTLKIVPLPGRQANEFYQNNHIQGACNCSINYGLVDKENNLLAAISFSNSRFTSKYKWELVRFCSLCGTSIVGGASKLLKHFIINHCSKDDRIVSYCNRRWSNGNLYHKLGFTLENTSSPGYYYITKNGTYAGTRQQWQKHKLKTKLENFQENLSEIQNMENHGYTRVWDCGQLVFVLTT